MNDVVADTIVAHRLLAHAGCRGGRHECSCGEWKQPVENIWLVSDADLRAHATHVADAVSKARTITSDNIREICWTPGTIIRAIETGAVYELVRYAHWNRISGPASNSGYIDLPAIVLWSPAVSS